MMHYHNSDWLKQPEQELIS